MQFAQEALGLTLYPAQAEALASFERGRYSQAIWQWGRQSGKSLIADVLVLYDAIVRESQLRPMLRPGQLRVAGIIAPSLDQAAKHIKEIDSMIRKNPVIASMIVRQTAYEIEFNNDTAIMAFPCSGRGLRGWTCSSVVLDEFGHFVDAQGSNAAGQEMLRSAEPSLTVFGKQGWLIMISTPRWKQGAFWEQVSLVLTRAKDFPFIHYLQRPSMAMNPTAGVAEAAEKLRRKDPAAFAQEYLAEFVDGISSYLSADDVLACKREENFLPPRPEQRYVAAIDPAYQHDNFALCIGHREGERAVIDGVWVWRKAGHEFTISEIARICQEYRVSEVRTDQHAPVPIREALERRNLAVQYVPWTNENKNEACNRLKIRCNLRTISLPADDELTSELLSLEARPLPGGLTRIAAARGAKDDRAISVASVIQAMDRADEIAVIFAGDDRDLSQPDEMDLWTRRLSGGAVIG